MEEGIRVSSSLVQGEYRHLRLFTYKRWMRQRGKGERMGTETEIRRGDTPLRITFHLALTPYFMEPSHTPEIISSLTGCGANSPHQNPLTKPPFLKEWVPQQGQPIIFNFA